MIRGLYVSLVLLGLVTPVCLSGGLRTVPGDDPPGPLLHSVSGRENADNLLREINPATGAILGAILIELPGEVVEKGTGLAVDPTTGIVHAVLKLAGNSNRVLTQLSLESGQATFIGDLGDRFASIAFDHAGELFGVTGNGAIVPESLYRIDKLNGDTAFVMPLGPGGEGEAIGYSPIDDLLYHASGEGLMQVFESVDAEDFKTRPIRLSGDTYTEATALVWDPALEAFRVTDRHTNMYILTTSGEVTEIASVGHVAKGLAFGKACAADVVGNGAVEAADLIAVVNSWGMKSVPADVNEDGHVDVVDLVEIILAWGACD